MHGKQTNYWLTLKYKIDFFNKKSHPLNSILKFKKEFIRMIILNNHKKNCLWAAPKVRDINALNTGDIHIKKYWLNNIKPSIVWIYKRELMVLVIK